MGIRGSFAWLAPASVLTLAGCGGTIRVQHDASVDADVPCVPAVVEVSGTCARKADGTLWCWGHNKGGQVGDGTAEERISPVQVGALGNGTAQVSATGDHVCARKTDGTLWCWGANMYGASTGTTSAPSFVRSPVQVAALGTSVADVAVAASRTCVRKTDDTLWCWGGGSTGAIGDGTEMDRFSPVQITALGTDVTEVSMSDYHTCARKADSTVWCWGENQYGELGEPTPPYKETLPVQVVAIGGNVAEVAAGPGYSCARKVDGTLWCWGTGWLGDGAFHMGGPPVQVATLGASVASISASYHTCARKTDNTLWCWRYNTYGELGDGTTENRLWPVQVAALGASVAQVSVGDFAPAPSRLITCVRKTDGTVWCWGRNDGSVGDGTVEGVPCPQNRDAGPDQVCRLLPVKIVGLCR